MPHDVPGPPPEAVLGEFGLRGVPVPLAGGQGTAWRVGEAVLKPAPDERFVEWQDAVLSRLDGRRDFRVAPPLPTRAGHWTHAGWAAWRYELGAPEPRRWRDVVEIGRGVHDAVSGEAAPDFLARRSDRWAVADRVAWGELQLPDGIDDAVVAELLAARRPLDLSSQLVHGDLTGNVLFHPHLPPLVIDFSPYWRPPGFATAVVLADVMVRDGSDEALARQVDDEGAQLLLRALAFRVVTDVLADPGEPPDRLVERYRRAVDTTVRLVRWRSR